MKKYYITGMSGFVSYYILQALNNTNERISVHGIDLLEPEFPFTDFPNLDISFEKLDLLDHGALTASLFQFQPEYIIHLASFSSVAFSWKNPVLSFRNNMNIFLNLVEVVKELNLHCRILSVGSSDEYGKADNALLPLREVLPPNPSSPYAVARVSQEFLSKIYVDGFGLDIVLTRSFNHIGPRQKELFVIAGFAKQLVSIKKTGKGKGELVAGNVNIIRDFVDVRDVARAYVSLLHSGRKGEIYNICSGAGTSLKSMIQKMTAILDVDAAIMENPKLMRPGDTPVIIGSPEKIKNEIGWSIEYTLEKSLSDILSYWMSL